MKKIFQCLSLLAILCFVTAELCVVSQPAPSETPASAVLSAMPPADGSQSAIPSLISGPSAAPTIRNITLNLSQYPGGMLPRYEKLEITFQVDTVAANLQLPYDSTPPAGVQPGIGISVDAWFSSDNWQTVYRQPAFYYQEFDDQVKSGQEWFYPTGNFSWKVRFAPNQVGVWQFRLVAQDAGGTTETAPQSFSVVSSSNKGYLRVSQRDSRYFEFEDQGYFPGLGYNMNFNHISWNNPVLENEENFSVMSENGIQLVRIWLSQWGIYGPSWNPWNSINPVLHGQYIPFSGLTFTNPYPGSEVSMRIDASRNPCMFIGWIKPRLAVKSNTTYRVRVRYRTSDMVGPRVPGSPFGFVAKTGVWLWGDNNDCDDPGIGQVLTPYQSQNTADWQIHEGSLSTGNVNFLPFFYLALENVAQGNVLIDYVWIEENLGNGHYGPNIVPKPWMAHHLYMEQRNSYAFDKVLDLAAQYHVYLRPVLMEKNDWIFNRIDYQGVPILYDPLCDDSDPNNDPPRCPGNNWFYGNFRQMTKVRWLQGAWWRYVQARWGYSTFIHSWELLNEGDPASGLHYALADEFGKYMHQFAPDHHLVSTSFWHSFPRDEFWANPAYPDIDFADVHRYVEESNPVFLDTALSTYNVSMQYGAKRPGGAGKPVIRGETGFVVSGSQPATDQFDADTDGLWLHNFIWGGVNPGGLIESYWYETEHIYKLMPNGQVIFDHRPHYRAFHNFIRDIPLNNGNYQDAQAVISNDQIRAWGQKDLVSEKAHLWIHNKDHTWKNVVDGNPPAPVSGVVRISGFRPGGLYTLQWWDPYQPDPARQIIRTETITCGSDGTIAISVQNLTTDIAVQVMSGQAPVLIPQAYIPLILAR